MSLIRLAALVYASLFFFVALMGYIPALVDENGLVLGLFTLDLHDNLLHAVSGLWALIAGLISNKEATRYFRLFGLIYLFDGVTGLIFGNAYLDLGIFLYGVTDSSFVFRFLTNIPHIAIGGSQVVIGFWLSKLFYRAHEEEKKNT